MKKIILAAVIAVFLTTALPASAQFIGLVPCDGVTIKCDFDYFIELVRRVVNYLIVYLGVPAAAGALVIAGVIMASAAGDPGKIGLAKKIIWTAVVGLILMLAAWLIVDTIHKYLGATERLPGGFGV